MRRSRPLRKAKAEARAPAASETPSVHRVCPVCGGPLLEERCKMICRSAKCVYRVVYSCAEY